MQHDNRMVWQRSHLYLGVFKLLLDVQDLICAVLALECAAY